MTEEQLFPTTALAKSRSAMTLIGRWYAVVQPRPPARQQVFSDGDSKHWLEWHWARGLDPYSPRRRSRIPERLRRAVIDRDGYVCGLCGGRVDPADVHIDHLMPVALGGRDELSNLQVAHSFCNISKGARV